MIKINLLCRGYFKETWRSGAIAGAIVREKVTRREK